MTDILHNCGHITHLMKIICMFEVFSAQCIRLFDRLSVIGVFNHFPAAKSPATKHGCRAWTYWLSTLYAAAITLMGEVR